MRKAKIFRSQKREAAILYGQGKKEEAYKLWDKATKGIVAWKAEKEKKRAEKRAGKNGKV